MISRGLPEGESPLLSGKEYRAGPIFTPENLLREGRRQRGVADGKVPRVCVLDPDGDIVRHLCAGGSATPCPHWACYHTTLYEFPIMGGVCGIIGCAVGGPFAVLVVEELFASGCELVVSITSAGQILPVRQPPYFVLIDRALRNEGTSHHYLAPAPYATLDPALKTFCDTAVVDVGGGTSTLVDHLLDEGYRDLTVLDISGAALKQAQARLGGRANPVPWIETDITAFRSDLQFRLWHDRAVFHFLTEADDQRRYAVALAHAIPVGAHAIIGTFAIDGPEKCSGWPVARYDAVRMVDVLGSTFRLIEQVDEIHLTPWQSEQRFSFFRLVRTGS
jgi:SAM-dependent methyltransferase